MINTPGNLYSILSIHARINADVYLYFAQLYMNIFIIILIISGVYGAGDMGVMSDKKMNTPFIFYFLFLARRSVLHITAKNFAVGSLITSILNIVLPISHGRSN